MVCVHTEHTGSGGPERPPDVIVMESIDSPLSETNAWLPSREPGTAVVTAVADATGREPTDLPPLHHRIDADALNRLLTRGAVDGDGPVHVSFSYAGVVVTIDSAGTLDVDPESVSPE